MALKEPEPTDPTMARLNMLEGKLEEIKQMIAGVAQQEYANSSVLMDTVQKMLPSEAIAGDIRRIADALAKPAPQPAAPLPPPPAPPAAPAQQPKVKRGLFGGVKSVDYSGV